MVVPIKLLSTNATAPSFQTDGSSAADIAACISGPVVLQPGRRTIVPTGFALEIPDGYEAQIRPRSGLSSKYGICLANGIGTIDSDYRGEVGVILINLGAEAFTIEPGMRIAQMTIAAYEKVSFSVTDDLSETTRGESGYGSTGH